MGSGKWGVDWKKPTTWMILAFIVLILWMFSKEAEATETGFEIAPGTMFVAGDRYNGGYLAMDNRFGDGKWAVGLGLTTTWTCPDANDCNRGEAPNNQFVYGQRIVEYKKFEMGLGISYWHNQTPSWSSHTPFALHIGWNFTDHVAVKWRHYSTAGSSGRNGGLDLLTFGWNF